MDGLGNALIQVYVLFHGLPLSRSAVQKVWYCVGFHGILVQVDTMILLQFFQGILLLQKQSLSMARRDLH